MGDRITYGVFWKTKVDEEWKEFSYWYTKWESARKGYDDLALNPICLQRKIVERTEMFEDIV